MNLDAMGATDAYRRLVLLLREPLLIGEVVRDGGTIVDWVVRDVNTAAVQLVSMTRDQAIGRRLTEVLEPEVAAATLAVSDEVMQTGSQRRFEIRSMATRRWYLVTVFRLDPQTLVSTSTDVTELKRTESALRDSEQALQRVNHELREADRRKNDFLGVLSHELRNPLGPIRNSAYLLGRHPSDAPQAVRARGVIERQVAHLAHLVDDLLEVTRIASGKIQLERKTLDLAALVSRTSEDHRTLLRERGLEFTVTVPAEPVWVHGDETRLAQIVGNLLQNAAKFTPSRGTVSVTVACTGDGVEIWVRDTGAGIDAAFLDRVFEPFVQSQQTLARAEGGLGLGLALVQSLASLHGGSATASSAGRDQGAEFVVRLPAAPSPTEKKPLRDERSTSERVSRRVLVVDDNRDAARSLADIVSLLGHRVEVVFDGESALAKAQESAPDVVLCDIGLPGLNGYEVARRIRRDSALEKVRLIAITGYAQPEDKRRASEAGFEEHLSKPLDPQRLDVLLR